MAPDFCNGGLFNSTVGSTVPQNYNQWSNEFDQHQDRIHTGNIFRQNPFGVSSPQQNNQFVPQNNQFALGNSHFPQQNNQFALGNSTFPPQNNQFALGNSPFTPQNKQFALGNSRFPPQNNQFMMPIDAINLGNQMPDMEITYFQQMQQPELVALLYKLQTLHKQQQQQQHQQQLQLQQQIMLLIRQYQQLVGLGSSDQPQGLFSPEQLLALQQQMTLVQIENYALRNVMEQERILRSPQYRLQFHQDGSTSTTDLLYMTQRYIPIAFRIQNDNHTRMQQCPCIQDNQDRQCPGQCFNNYYNTFNAITPVENGEGMDVIQENSELDRDDRSGLKKVRIVLEYKDTQTQYETELLVSDIAVNTSPTNEHPIVEDTEPLTCPTTSEPTTSDPKNEQTDESECADISPPPLSGGPITSTPKRKRLFRCKNDPSKK